MNFEEFKKRYEAKLLRAGLTIPGSEDADYASFQDQMATIYVGITIYSEIQHEALEKQRKEYAELMRKQKPSIILTNNGIIQ